MDDDTLRATIEQVIYVNSNKQHSRFIWHGGEPLLRGRRFFERVVELQKPYCRNHEIKNSIQTNGTLLSAEMADFCAKKGITIGLSLDGPANLNNQTRIYKNGGSTYSDIVRAIKIAKQKKIGGGFITVLNKVNIKHIPELYVLFKRHKVNPKVNPLIRSGKAVDCYEALEITPLEYAAAMIELFDLWFYDSDSDITIEPFDLIIGNIATGVPMGCNFSTCQDAFVSIGPQGDIYPCGRFDGISKFKLGNIHKEGLERALVSPLRRKLLSRSKETVKGCRRCKYNIYCNAGCMHNAFMVDGNIFGRDYYCASYKMIFKHIIEALDVELKKAEVDKDDHRQVRRKASRRCPRAIRPPDITKKGRKPSFKEGLAG